jgi:hypothetical protein
MRRVLAASLLLLVLLAGAAPGSAALAGSAVWDPTAGHAGGTAAASGDAAATAPATDPDTMRELQQEFDRTEFRITVDANGSAEWTFRFKQTLENDTERADFRAFAEGFNDGSTGLYTDFQRRAGSLTAAGANATGRPMNATVFSKRAYVNTLGNQGIVEMSFRWTAFAVVADDGTVTVGDVFDGGLYIRSDQRLVVSAGEGMAFDEASPAPDSISGDSLAGSESLTWEGERSFTDERPRIVLAPPSAATGSPTPTGAGGNGNPNGTATATSPGGSPTGGGGTSPAGDGGTGLLPLVGLGAVLLLGLGAVFAYRSGMFGGTDAAAPGGGTDGGSGGAVAVENESEAPGTAESTTDGEPAIPDEELLSDEDRVMGLLDDRGGRMKQVEIVEETGWSKSKVSMLLSDMEEAGEISKLRVGRENIISKKGMEPDAAGSPFEEGDG